jgi:hypothetical protein
MRPTTAKKIEHPGIGFVLGAANDAVLFNSVVCEAVGTVRWERRARDLSDSARLSDRISVSADPTCHLVFTTS